LVAPVIRLPCDVRFYGSGN